MGRASLANKTAWSTVAHLCSAINLALANIVAARLLGPAAMGQLAYLLWIATMFLVVLDFGLLAVIRRYLAELSVSDAHDQAPALMYWAGTRLVSLLVLGSLGLIAGGFLVGAETPAVWILVGFAFLSIGLSNILWAMLDGMQQFRQAARLKFGATLIQLIGVAAGAFWWGLQGALMGYVVGGSLPGAILFSKGRSLRTAPRLSAALRRRVKRYAGSAWLAAVLSAVVWSRLEIFFLERYWDDEAVGFFTVGLSLATLAMTGPLMMGRALLPHFSERVGAGDLDAARQSYAASTRLMALLILPAGLGCAAVVPVLLPLLYGAVYTPAVPVAMVLTTFATVGAVAGVGSSLLYGMERASFIAASSAVGAVLAIGACLLVIPAGGVWGAAWVRVGVQTSMVGAGTWYIHRRLACPVPFRGLAQALLVGLICSAAMFFVTTAVHGPMSLLLSLPLGVIIYVLALRFLGGLSATDARRVDRFGFEMPVMLARWVASFTAFVQPRK